MISGILLPQQKDSELVLRDARQAFPAMIKAEVAKATILTEANHLANL
jgi:hypothetical protein